MARMNFLRLGRKESYNFFEAAMAGIFLIILAVNFLNPPKKVALETGQREKIQKEIVFWQKTTEGFPGYRDGYLKLAVLNWKIYQTDEAQKFLQKALEIDPNNETIKRFKEMIK